MTDTPTPTSADVIEGMREALRRYIFTRHVLYILDGEKASDDNLLGFEIGKLRLLRALALPDSKPDNQGGA